jgi:hypothetical protein
MMSDVAQSIRDGLLLSTLLAGFAITALLEVISLGKTGPIATAAIIAFLAAAAMTLVSTVGGFLALSATSGWAGLAHPPTWNQLVSFNVGVGNWALLGLLAFLVGVGLTGWLRSRRVGIVSTLLMALSLAVIVSMMLRLIRLQSG